MACKTKVNPICSNHVFSFVSCVPVTYQTILCFPSESVVATITQWYQRIDLSQIKILWQYTIWFTVELYSFSA